MDMCYDGTLVMPREFAMMDEEEMTYTEGGGWNGKVFVRNLAGFLSLAAGMDWFLGKIGVDVSAFIARGLANYWNQNSNVECCCCRRLFIGLSCCNLFFGNA